MLPDIYVPVEEPKEERILMAMEELRREAEENQLDLDSRCYYRDYSRRKKVETSSEKNGSFFLRTALCLLIFCGFLWLMKENRSILGMAPKAVQEVIGRSVDLKDLTDSVKMTETP